MSFKWPPRLSVLARRRQERLAFAPPVLSSEERTAEQDATLAILRERLAPETYDEVREMIVCEWEDFERRARARFGEEGFFTILELMLTEYPPNERVRLEMIPAGDLRALPSPAPPI